MTTGHSVLIDPAADEFAHQRVRGDEALVDVAEKLQRGQHLPQLVKALDALGHRGKEFGGRGVEKRGLIGVGGVEAQISLFLKRRDVGKLAPADVAPHGHGHGRVGAAEIVVPHHAAHQAEPGALEDDAAVEDNVAPGGDVELEGLGMPVGDHVVQGVDALEDHHLVLLELDGLGGLLNAHLAGELILRHIDPLALGQLGEVLVQKLHVQAQGRLQVDVPLRGAGRGGRVHGVEVVVHRHIMAAHALLLQRGGDLHGRGGLA